MNGPIADYGAESLVRWPEVSPLPEWTVNND
jgi:hypothetical protein